MSQSLELECRSLEQLPDLAAKLLDFIGDPGLVLIQAEMGAGKTTLIKAICRHLGSTDDFSSPTFSLVNEYAFGDKKIFHLDLYRIQTTDELLDLGIEEYLDSGSWCFVEWPGLLMPLVQGNYVSLEIRRKGDIRYFRALKN
ncbi:MAG TPA: tRNA (adenosine(37)-N6)-threonylcarbamoyltransferase complex ATPase subunit type 1 TsaE [Bacteroidia bacterium]|nr:tRNA (adenosine(37)-N6)-threonylcarbamoyltransferase complex ATPase subunit type 1 TsaE [Bacteroidia bacterium]